MEIPQKGCEAPPMPPETPKTFPSPPAADQLVTVDPDKLLLLGTALGRTADRASTFASIVEGALAEVGLAADPLGTVRAFAAWCQAEEAALQGIVHALLDWEAS